MPHPSRVSPRRRLAGLLLGLWAAIGCSQATAPSPTPVPSPSAGALVASGEPGAASASASSASSAASEAPALASASASAAASASATERGERWESDLVDSGPCPPHRETGAAETVSEPDGPRKVFSYHGYTSWKLRVQRTIEGQQRTHCVEVLFPPGKKNSDGAPVAVAARIDEGWLRGIENTLLRLPWRHLQVVRRVVIDDRPKEHGIGPFDRRKSDDARDGRTLWLHERLFTETNHWAVGNHGRYWSYHLDVDGEVFDDRAADHPRFSPVLLHEIGHLINYSVINKNPGNEGVPACAKVCGDHKGGCKGMLPRVKEEGCISAYCMPFKFETGTENWAEMYRFYYQSSVTRGLLGEAKMACLGRLDEVNAGLSAPWSSGLPDIAGFHRTLWRSCDERACKKW